MDWKKIAAGLGDNPNWNNSIIEKIDDGFLVLDRDSLSASHSTDRKKQCVDLINSFTMHVTITEENLRELARQIIDGLIFIFPECDPKLEAVVADEINGYIQIISHDLATSFMLIGYPWMKELIGLKEFKDRDGNIFKLSPSGIDLVCLG